MRLRSALLFVIGSYACGGSDYQVWTDAPPTDSNTQAAVARWTLNSSDCPGDETLPPTFESSGSVTIEEDRIQIGLTTMPVLTGRLDSGRAQVSGVTQFWQEEWITCTVNGTAEVTNNLVVAQVGEALTSESTLNCNQDWRVELEF